MQKSGANVGKGSRLCENGQEPTRRRIVFSIVLFPVAAAALFVFRLTKSRRTFYAKIECLCFHTASMESQPFCGGMIANVERIVDASDFQAVPLDLIQSELQIFVHAARRHHRCENFAAVRWSLDRQEAACAAAYHIKSLPRPCARTLA